MKDSVNHPSHYNSHPCGIEAIDLCEQLPFNLGNAIKYLWRWREKGGVDDLQKALWYIKREQERRHRDRLTPAARIAAAFEQAEPCADVGKAVAYIQAAHTARGIHLLHKAEHSIKLAIQDAQNGKIFGLCSTGAAGSPAAELPRK